MRNFVFLSISSIIIFACIFQLARLSNRTFSEGITSPSGMETSEVELFSSFKVDHPFEVVVVQCTHRAAAAAGRCLRARPRPPT